MARKDDKKSAKDQFEKAADDVPLWMQVTLLAQLLLARVLTQKEEEVPEAKPLVREEQGNPMEQLHSGHFRFYSPAELDRLLEVTYQLKDIVQTNCLAMRGLEDATVKNDSPQAAELRKSMNEFGAAKRIDSETALGAYMLWLGQIKSFRKSATVLYRPRPDEGRLPVVDCERQLVVDIADSISRSLTNMAAMQQNIAKAQTVLNIPQLDRINREYARHNEKINDLVVEISDFAINSLGQRTTASSMAPASP